MRLCLNVDHIATLRNARGETTPDPVSFALMAEQYGIEGIVVHLREDRRHIKERDLRLLRELITTKLDLEMAAVDEIIEIACDVQPELVTLVPEKRQELTTEGGINVIDSIKYIRLAIERLHEVEIPVSIFIEPDINQIDAASQVKADLIEIHTGIYANAKTEDEMFDELERVRVAAKHAKKLGLGVNAGHGLNYINIREFIAIGEIDEVSIGHAILARSMYVGIEKAIQEMRSLINSK